jgi:secreted trypsin-like serine protease
LHWPGGPAALAATKRLPIKSGPNGVSRTSGGITTKIVGGKPVPDRMQEAQVLITSRAECRTAYATAGLTIDATMLCAGRTNLDTCQGDSGGPLFFKAAGSPGYIQAGITRWGIGWALARPR